MCMHVHAVSQHKFLMPGASGSIDVEPFLSLGGVTRMDDPVGQKTSKYVKRIGLRLSVV